MADKMRLLCRELQTDMRLDYRWSWIAQGVEYARGTGRLSGEIELRLRSMTRRQALALVKRIVADEAVMMGDVPSWLIRWHYGVPSPERS